MKQIKNGITKAKNELALYRNAPNFVPAGQATQLVVGASQDNDKKIVELAEGLYKTYSLKRVFYSAFIPVPTANALLPTSKTPLLREHRLYQADFLLRFYGFDSKEIFENSDGRLNLNMDPKCYWAVNNLDKFPVEINKADKMTLLRVPGIGTTSVEKIMKARRAGPLNFDNLKKMGIVLKRAKYFITCSGRMFQQMKINEEVLEMKLSENKINESYDQLTLAEDFGVNEINYIPPPKMSLIEQAGFEAAGTGLMPLPTREDEIKCLTGQL